MGVAGAALVLFAAACTRGGGDAAGERADEPSRPGFREVAREVGLTFRHGAFRWSATPDPAAMMGGGICWLDFDDDGWLDLFVVNSYAEREASRWLDGEGLPRTALYRNEGGRFVDVGAGSGADLPIRGTGCVAADLDLDGRTDLYVTSDRGGALLWNEGDGRFAEGAGEAGAPSFGWYAGIAAGDLNGDGWPDLFLAGYVDLNNRIPEATLGFPNTYRPVRDLLYLSNGPGDGGRVTFREVGVEAGLEAGELGYGLGALLTDVDRDGDLDLYVANDTNPNRLYQNVPWPGGIAADPAGLGFRFEEVAAGVGVADPDAGMGVAAGDFDGDGWVDLFVTNASGQRHAAYRSTGAGASSFADVRGQFGPELVLTGWGVSWVDVDLDTDLDLVLVNGEVPVRDVTEGAQPVQAFANMTAQGERGRFEEASASLGLGGVGPLLARGSAAADYDNDGDLDVAVNTIGGPLALLETVGTSGGWLEVALDGFHPGAVVTAVLPGGTELVREVHAGSSYLSSEDPRVHFGLGPAEMVRELRVRWPGGERTTLSDVAAGQVLVLEPPSR